MIVKEVIEAVAGLATNYVNKLEVDRRGMRIFDVLACFSTISAQWQYLIHLIDKFVLCDDFIKDVHLLLGILEIVKVPHLLLLRKVPFYYTFISNTCRKQVFFVSWIRLALIYKRHMRCIRFCQAHLVFGNLLSYEILLRKQARSLYHMQITLNAAAYEVFLTQV
jgi:hypothetical protein